LPMTSLPSIRFTKRDTSGLTFDGPNSGYMSSLARLFDSAQILGMPFLSLNPTTSLPRNYRTLTNIQQTKSRVRSRIPASSTRRPRTLVSNSRPAMPRSSSDFISAASCSRMLQ
jgi:hypothetical protein